jgi:hypothetical protein
MPDFYCFCGEIEMKFRVLLFGLDKMLKYYARKDGKLGNHLRGKSLTAQIKVADDSAGRSFTFRNGK